MKRGFSRLEIVLFLCVAATTSALVWPVSSQGFFWRARENARRASCQSNLKQVAFGVMQYTQDYDEVMPLAVVQGPRNGFGWANNLQPYLRDREIFSCPRERNPPSDNVMQRGYTDYWYNQNLSRRSLAQIEEPALTLLHGDGDGGSAFSNARYNINALPKSWISTPNSPALRHLNGANYAFADGHVKWLPLDHATITPTRAQGSLYTFSIR